jgi:hypothetical protein
MGGFGLWYVAVITALFAYFGSQTRYRWAPLTCVTLLLLVSTLVPPSPRGIEAIAVTQGVDSLLLILAALPLLERNRVVRIGNLIGQLALLPVVGMGALALYLFGCGIGLAAFIPGSLVVILWTWSRRGSRPSGESPRSIPRQFRLFEAGATLLLVFSAFSLPSLLLLRRRFRGSSDGVDSDMQAMLALSIPTSLAFALNMVGIYLRFGSGGLPWILLGLALGGALVGKALAMTFPLRANGEALYHGYLVVLLAFSIIGAYYLLIVLGAR